MTIYQRYFRVTSGPLMDEVRKIEADNDRNRQAVLDFAAEIGATNMFSYKDGTVSGFEFDKTPDQSIWKQPNSFGHYLPRKNTNGGKEMAKRIQGMPRLIGIGGALKSIGLYDSFPVLFGNGKGYISTLTGTTRLGVMFVSVPWKDINPEELAQYKRDNAAGIHSSAELEHLGWQPTADMQEIKHWEMEKEIEELNLRLREMEKEGAPA